MEWLDELIRKVRPNRAGYPRPYGPAGAGRTYVLDRLGNRVGERRKPELIFCCPSRYKSRYETLCDTHIIRTHARFFSYGNDDDKRRLLDWYARRRLQGANLRIMTDGQSDDEADVAAAVARATGARRIILGPSAYGSPIVSAAQSGQLMARLRMELHSKSQPKMEVFATPVGGTPEEYKLCANMMVDSGADGLCINPHVSIVGVGEMASALRSRVANGGRHLYLHAHNPFSNPFMLVDLRSFDWLDSVSTDAPFTAAVDGRRYADGVTAADRGYSANLYQRWRADYRDFPLNKEQMSDADWNHMQALRIWNGYVGAVPSYGEPVGMRSRP
jgi:hypothetical protein